MANWERREADTLAAAIKTHRKTNPALDGVNRRLEVVQIVVARAAKTVATTGSELNSHRALVCRICRDSALYACDVPVGWSMNCALVSANASDFGVL
jgi:hypothetical protein